MSPDERESLASRLRLVHFDGNGCGTHGNNACSVCHGPSPMTADEIAADLGGTVEQIIASRVSAALEAAALAIHIQRFAVEERKWGGPDNYYNGAISAARIVRSLAPTDPVRPRRC